MYSVQHYILVTNTWNVFRPVAALSTFRVAEIQQQVRPVAAVRLVVVCEARFTWGRVGHAMRAFDVVVATLCAFRIDTEPVQTAGGADWCHWNRR
jgi:hypothetical protein